ncbi:MAG: lasso peptide biosynthesis B2 protein [Chloroflexota bacterium]|nr:lasso peptide biosynthesis B2 protein [Chloroflexota bacterium]
MKPMHVLEHSAVRVRRGVIYLTTLFQTLAYPGRRQLLRDVVALGRALPHLLDQPLPVALEQLTPPPVASDIDPEQIREIVDATTSLGLGRPLGMCLRRSLLRHYFLRQAGIPTVVNFGARRQNHSVGGHAWLTFNGKPYHERPEHYRGYTLLFTYPDQDKQRQEGLASAGLG